MPTPHSVLLPRRAAIAHLLLGIGLPALGLLPNAAAAATDPKARALEQATQLVDRMKAFDAGGVADLTYTQLFERQGIDPARAREAAAQLYEHLQSIGAHYVRFDLLPAEPPFPGEKRLYVILPYVQVMEAKGRRIQAEAFFIGISEDQGQNWKFVDGAGASDEGVRQAIPGYNGTPPLPPRRQRPVQ